MAAIPARPEYTVGDVVSYRDRQDRLQIGKVMRVEASWAYRDNPEPFLIYTIRHPTYRDRRIYCSGDVIYGLSNQEPHHG